MTKVKNQVSNSPINERSVNPLPDINEVRPLSEGDREFLKVAGEFFRAHRQEHRFGIMLLHQHFDLYPGEILIEETDVNNRRQQIGPRLRSEFTSNPEGLMETQWRFGVQETANLICLLYCSNGGLGHLNAHIPK